MQEKDTPRALSLWTVTILLGAGIVSVAIGLAFKPSRNARPTTTQLPSTSDVRLEDFSLSNYEGLITVGTHDLELRSNGAETSTSDAVQMNTASGQ